MKIIFIYKMTMFLIFGDTEKLHVVPQADVGSVFVVTVSPATAGLMLGVCVVIGDGAG